MAGKSFWGGHFGGMSFSLFLTVITPIVNSLIQPKQLAYKPLTTPLLRQIRLLRQQTGQAWVTVDGLEFIPEQGIAQFELMTGRKAPRKRMREEVQGFVG